MVRSRRDVVTHQPQNGRLGDAAALRRAARTARREQLDLLCDAFERLPYGVALAGPAGAIVASNPAFRELTGLGADADGPTCCELFGCHRSGGPLDGVCLTEAAIDARDRLNEVRVELPRSGRHLYVTAAPLAGHAVRVVFQVRAASVLPSLWLEGRDAAVGRLRIFSLGRTRVETPERPLAGAWLEQRAGQLLKLLVCERHRVVATEEIAEALWPNPRSATPNTVRHFVHALRDRLEPERPRRGRSSFILARRGGYTLDTGAVWIDADEFEGRVGRGLAAFADGRTEAATEDLERALTLYRGDFLAEDPYAEWAFAERERLRSLVERPLRALSELRADDPDASAAYLERLAGMEPFDHEVQRQLMTLWVRQGRLSRAKRHYHAFELRLLREFGERPGFRLWELAGRR